MGVDGGVWVWVGEFGRRCLAVGVSVEMWAWLSKCGEARKM